jgi:hypothetical protein
MELVALCFNVQCIPNWVGKNLQTVLLRRKKIPCFVSSSFCEMKVANSGCKLHLIIRQGDQTGRIFAYWAIVFIG